MEFSIVAVLGLLCMAYSVYLYQPLYGILSEERVQQHSTAQHIMAHHD